MNDTIGHNTQEIQLSALHRELTQTQPMRRDMNITSEIINKTNATIDQPLQSNIQLV